MPGSASNQISILLLMADRFDLQTRTVGLYNSLMEAYNFQEVAVDERAILDSMAGDKVRGWTELGTWGVFLNFFQ